ncbi:MAG: serine--tRNA ligase, partial [Sphingobacteriales bacterium]
MLPIQLFRQEKDRVIAGLQKKNFKELALVDRIIELDEQRRHLQVESEAVAASQNQASKAIGQLMAAGKKEEAEQKKAEVSANKDKAKELSDKVDALEQELHDTLVKLPNLPHQSVPPGKTPEENEVVRSWGQTPDLSAQKLPHWELAEKYGLIDFELGNKITGSGFPVYT